MSLFEGGHEFAVTEIHAHSEQQEHASSAEEEGADGEAGLFEEILQAVNWLQVDGFASPLNDVTGERVNEVDCVFPS